MYNISDLNAMSESELKSIAESMGMKKIDSTPKDDLIYRILDQQAIDMAASATEKKRRATKESKPRKEKSADKSAQEIKVPEKAKKQKEKAPEEVKSSDEQQVQAPETDVVKAASQSAPEETPQPAANKRGRKKKQSAAAEEPAKVENMEAESVPTPMLDEDDHDDLTLIAPLPKEMPVAETSPVENKISEEAPAEEAAAD